MHIKLGISSHNRNHYTIRFSRSVTFLVWPRVLSDFSFCNSRLFKPFFRKLKVSKNHGVIILNRSNSSVFLYLKIYWNLSSHRRLGHLNETRNALSPGFFLKILNSVFESINMGLDHKLFLQLSVIGFCFFAVELEKDKYRDFL